MLISLRTYVRGTSICFSLLLVAFLVLFFFPDFVYAIENKIETKTQRFSIKLGETRLVYNTLSPGKTLTVINQQDYPILVQALAFSEDMKNKAPFVVTPPLFRLDGQQQSRLRIVRTGGDFAKDRESLQWLCVKALPPKADDVWAIEQNGKNAIKEKSSSILNIQLSINSCMKLLVRPESINNPPSDLSQSLSWHRQGNQIKAVNNSPFYINLSSLNIGGKKISNIHYIPPFSSYIFHSPSMDNGKVNWTAINDYGGESKVYQSEIQ
ncbi:molecular chaperone [Edwardsiella tarda]|uniref:Molecular chaperone n=2 Tax=Edwardsiella tarda TaxID=636 RepID=A0A2A7U7T2_EDWTA|nr:molecular chaperone [Edwardsiella tarda]